MYVEIKEHPVDRIRKLFARIAAGLADRMNDEEYVQNIPVVPTTADPTMLVPMAALAPVRPARRDTQD